MVDITPLINAVIALIAASVTIFIIPYIKKKIKAEDLEELQKWVDVGVKMAEQLAKSGVIDKYDRRDKVLEFLHSKGYDVDFETIVAMIEASVLALPPFIDPDDDEEDEYEDL